MNFESPSAAWLGLALPVIVALWLLRPRRTRVRTSSVMLWRAAAVERQAARPWQRLRNHPLLWLQLLVAALLVAVAVRPFLPASAQTEHIVLMLDASGSMRATDVGPDRFAAAQARAIDFARGLGPGQRLSVVRLDEAPRVLVADASGDDATRVIEDQEPGYGAANLTAAFALASGIAPGTAEWLLISDGGIEAPAGVRLPDGASLRTVVVAPENAGGNVAVTGMRVRIDGQRASVQVGMRNTGASETSGRVVLSAEGELLGGQEWTLAAGEERFLSWSGVPSAKRWFEARLTDVPQTANALNQDDRAWAAAPVDAQRRLLLVSPGNTFLERLFSVSGSLRADRVAPAAWEPVAAGTPYDLILFDGVRPEMPPPTSNLLYISTEGGAFKPGRIEPRAEHPLLQHVDWSDVSIAEAGRLPIDAGWEVVVDSTGGPLLAVREAGGRREAALAFDLTHSDLALRAAFPVLMSNLIEWLTPGVASEPLLATPGESIRLDAGPLAERVIIRGASGVSEQLAPPWPPAVFRPPAPGLYEIEQSGPSGMQPGLLIASGYTPSESSLDVRPLTLEDGGESTASGLPDAARSLWPLLALGVIAVALWEWWVDARGR